METKTVMMPRELTAENGAKSDLMGEFSIDFPRIAENDRPAEFVMMEELNSLPKFEDAGRPFADIWFMPGHGGWWAECPITGYGYWYKTLCEAVRRWRVTINGYDGLRWLATPNAELSRAGTDFKQNPDAIKRRLE